MEGTEAAQEVAANTGGAAFSMLISKTSDSFTFHIQTDNAAVGIAMTVGVVGVAAAALGLAAFYYSSQRNARETRDGFGRAFGGDRPDRDVGDVNRGSLLVDLHCYTAESFLEFLTDYESGKVKERLKEELSKIGIDVEHLTITISNLKEAEEHRRKLSLIGIERNVGATMELETNKNKDNLASKETETKKGEGIRDCKAFAHTTIPPDSDSPKFQTLFHMKESKTDINAVDALGRTASKLNTVSDEERRWVVVGVCLTKVLTPALRDVLANEMPKWHQKLLQPPCEIDKQTFGKHEKVLPPSTLKLNYESINNNTAHKSRRVYDYTVKDPLSLAKLFIKPSMAKFAGFDQTMDASAVLSVMCEAQPFIASGAAVIAKKIRSDIRNEWAHCNFSHWTEPIFQAALQDMELLIKKTNLTPVEEKRLLDELHSWKDKGLQLCFGQAVDPVLLKLIQCEVTELKESVQLWKDDSQDNQEILKQSLAAINTGLKQEEAREEQNDFMDKYTSTCQDIKEIRSELSKVVLQRDEDVAYVFRAPQANPCFSGQKSELLAIKSLLAKQKKSNKQSKVSLAAICGLGGSGKTSLVVEYAQQMKDHYEGGVFWFSGEDDTHLQISVNDVAMEIGTFLHDSFDMTLSKTLDRISRISKPWLIVIDDMDELHLSQNLTKIISGAWQQGVTGHVVITTRRKPSALANDVRGFQEDCCVQLECFRPEEAKTFLFRRTGIKRDEETERAAENLVAELESLPLALEQAGAYIKSLGCSLSSYLESYKAQCLRLLNQQKASRVSAYESQEKLSVKTTWLLNFEHIKQCIGGGVAMRFLNACAFFSASEIQEDLVNVGKPFVEDEEFCKFLSTSRGCQQVLKMLTDFSLFKELEKGCMSLHRLVQNVIQENLSCDEKAESFVDAVRLLHHAYSKCPSPDELLKSMADGQRPRAAINTTDPFLFSQWSKLCLHSREICKHLTKFVKSAASSEKTVFFAETARVVYERALHLSVNSRHEEAKQMIDLAYRILDWSAQGKHELSEENFQVLFPHILPLPELVRRHILYSSKNKPNNAGEAAIEQIPLDSDNSDDLDEMRLAGNRHLKKGCFKQAINLYSAAINMSKRTHCFDATLLINRASAFLKLEQYDDALQDAEDYIEQCPECWKGYARKALALDGLNKNMNARCFAALAYSCNKNVVKDYMPFREAFPGVEECIEICKSSSQLLTILSMTSLLESTMPGKQRSILLEPGVYEISLRDFERGVLQPMVFVKDCILLGNISRSSNSKVCLNFEGNCCLCMEGNSAASNINFIFDQGSCISRFSSEVIRLFNCSFSNNNKVNPVYQSTAGKLDVDSCCFKNCKAGGLLVAHSGTLEVQNSSFSGNGKSGLEVREGGQVTVSHCDCYDNRVGVTIGPGALNSIVKNCLVHDNVEGILVVGKSNGVISDNRIFHNEHFGITVNESCAIIKQNNVFDNCLWGIWTQSNSLCHISSNSVYRNKVGGMRIGTRQAGDGKQTVVEFNKIVDNGGPGIDEAVVQSFELHSMSNYSLGPSGLVSGFNERIPGLKKAVYKGNELVNNKEKSGQKTTESAPALKLCSYCQKEGNLRKCSNCFTAEYCGRNCQKAHWKTHRNICPFYLEQASCVIHVSVGFRERKSADELALINSHHPGLEPVGPAYAEPPQQNGSRFIVKVQAGDRLFKLNVNDEELLVYDRSLTIYGRCECPYIGYLVKEHGEICQRKYVEKKLFFWALYCEDGGIRIFTNEFAPSQSW